MPKTFREVFAFFPRKFYHNKSENLTFDKGHQYTEYFKQAIERRDENILFNSCMTYNSAEHSFVAFLTRQEDCESVSFRL